MATFIRSDLDFILTQIRMAEAGQPPVNAHLSFGLRQVNGENNSVVPGQVDYGAADGLFPRVGDAVFTGAESGTSYAQSAGLVIDSAPRTISNLISDQSSGNAAAVEAAAAASAALGTGYQHSLPGADGVLGTADDVLVNANTPAGSDASLFINNVTPDNGLSAPFNTWMAYFGQFFDHGLDLVNKGGSGTVFIPLKPDDPLYVAGSPTNFMVLTRATNQPGADGILGTSDDVHEGTNSVTPFVDQNQTYSSHPSHQVFLREYATGADGRIHATGRLLDHVNSDGSHHMATWADVKANALKLGIRLTDEDVHNVPLLATDEYGNFIPHPVTGMAQIVMKGQDHLAGTADDVLVSGTPANPVSLADAVRTGHAFLNDIAHGAAPSEPGASGAHLVADADLAAGGPVGPGAYDNELLDAHYIAGDGRANENMGLTAVHEVFHAEHNRLIEQTKALIRAELANGDTSFASNWVVAGANLADGIAENEWNGERLFQVAKFGTETQYQHLVFEEFARKIAPTIHLFGNSDIHLDPAVTAEFAHAVYRFGHSMLNETFTRYEMGTDGTPVLDAEGRPVLSEMGLIDAFTNPLAYAAGGADAAGEIVLGAVNQVGNEIDEFVTGTLRNNLLGLPLDLAALNIARGRETGVPSLNLLRNQIYSQTQDTALKPYDNWEEFGQFLKHPASLVNFIAAYGTHASITAAATLADKRSAALDLVTHGLAAPGSAGFSQDAYNFLHSAGAYANQPDSPHPQWGTGSVTGVDAVDLWIGGLAEKQNLFGGLLGSTFNFIFETQLENLQDGDRLYYLPRLEGTHWGTEVEGNSFADLIMRNTGAHHLSASIFLTPEYVVEAGNIDPSDQSTWLRNPETGKLLVDVMADGTVRFIGDDNFLGNTMVLGGTAGNDRLLAGQADDDTVYGDGGDDWIDGGNGNDFLYGGTGNDTITDSAGDDTIHGDEGNDLIKAGIGDDIVFGGDGNDLVDGGQGIDTIAGGLGNDIILAGEGDDEVQGNEGDDWIDGGAGGDLLVGDSAAPTGQVPLFGGNDVLVGGTEGDRMQGFSGDDIMTGLGGFDRFEGKLGYDWAVYQDETQGVSVDMNRKEFITAPNIPAGDAIRDVFIETEGVSGSSHDDVLQGTDNRLADPFNELTNVGLINGLRSFFPGTRVNYSNGNIMLGGGGSDIIEGRGGNDIIDGDAALHVRLTGSGPGATIVREITSDGHTGDIDVARYRDVMGNYTIEFPDAQGFYTVSHILPTGAIGIDGVDRVRNIERLQFSDGMVNLEGPNGVPFGAPLILGDTNPATAIVDPVIGQALTVNTVDLFDGDGIVGPFSYQWQTQDGARLRWIPIAGATGASYTPGDFQQGSPLRVEVRYVDGLGLTESVVSAQTANVAFPPQVNTAPFVVQQQALTGLPDTTTRERAQVNLFLPLLTVFADAQTPSNQLVYTATLANGQPLASMGLAFAMATNGAGQIIGARVTGSPPDNFIGAIEIRVSATDTGPGTPLTVTDNFIINVQPNLIVGTNGADILSGTGAVDQIMGLDGNDTLSGLGGDDILDGGNGNDILNGNAGNDKLIGGAGDDTLNGNAGDDTMAGGLGSDTYVVDSAADVVTELSGQGIDTVQTTLASYALGANVENLEKLGNGDFSASGNALDNIISGAGGNDTLDGGLGNDTLNGGNGADTLRGGEGNDTLNGNAGADSMAGGAGNDTYIVDSNGDTVTEAAGEGTDLVQTTLQAYTLANNVENLAYVGSGNFSGTGNALNNTISGGAGNDTLDGGAGADTMAGGAGDDTYLVDSAQDIAVELAGGGIDTVQTALGSYTLGGELENLKYTGAATFAGTGNALGNVITGGSGNDSLAGGGGDDTLVGGAGQDALAGGIGNDIYVVDNNGDTVTEQANEGTDTVQTALGSYFLGANVENLAYTGAVNFTGTGNALDNRLAGGVGNDTLDGLGGIDTLIGGAGNDIYVVDNAADVVIEAANGGTDLVRASASSYTLSAEVENLNYVGLTNFTGTGNTLDNQISSGAGADVLDGGAGIDRLSGGGGDDIYLVDNTLDLVVELNNAGTDLVRSTASAYTLGANVENLTFTGGGNFTGTGNNLANTLVGGAGNDVLDGLGGADIMTGGLGNDTYYVNVNGDVVNEDAGGGVDTVISTGNGYTLGANVENLTQRGIGGGTLNGNALDNVLTGDIGADTLRGLDGNDILIGGDGDDLLIGGAGNDVFMFSTGFGHDSITGFDANPVGGQDLLDLTGLGITAATFGNVHITDAGADTMVTIGTDSILLAGVGNHLTVTIDDFILS